MGSSVRPGGRENGPAWCSCVTSARPPTVADSNSEVKPWPPARPTAFRFTSPHCYSIQSLLTPSVFRRRRLAATLLILWPPICPARRPRPPASEHAPEHALPQSPIMPKMPPLKHS
jgi:hypothetical protein